MLTFSFDYNIIELFDCLVERHFISSLVAIWFFLYEGKRERDS